MKTAAVIGAGLGGLSAAINAACKGYRVTVYESAATAGGKAGELNEHGFRFDTGPSLLTMPFVITELFTRAGKNPEDYLTLEPLEVLCKYFFADGTVLNAYADSAVFAAEIEAVTGTGREVVHRYLRYCKQIYDTTAELFLFSSFQSLRTLLRFQALQTMLQLGKIDALRTMHQANASFFSDQRLQQLFDRYATYNGSSPYLAPATLNIIQHVEYKLGGYIVRGGMRRLPEALTRLADELGVTFRFNTTVQNIAASGKRVTGITTPGGTEQYDAVIANADVYSVYKTLLTHDRPSREARRYTKLEPSSSALVFYWGVQGSFPELEIHNILFSENYEQEFKDLFERRICPEDATVYLYISQKFVATDAPEGCTNWFVMINAPYHHGQNWEPEIQRCRAMILARIKKALGIDLTDKIVSESVLTPALLEQQTGSTYGSIYGISSNNRNAAFLRQKNVSSSYKGLYFCGGSAHPGGGIPLVLLSGKMAAEELP